MADKLKYPIGIQSFSEIRENGYLYIDKTEYIYQLVSRGKYYLLNRPQGFGKSLLISTLHGFFNGRRDLFEGLDISQHDIEWKKFPVIHIDFAGVTSTTKEGFNDSINNILNELEKKFDIEHRNNLPGVRFGEIINKISEKYDSHVVILIDNYDFPLLDSFDNPELFKAISFVLKSIYSNLKKMDQFIKFGMLVGSVKFDYLSAFGDFNNLRDLSVLPQYAPICGFSADELSEYCQKGIAVFAVQNNLSVEDALQDLKENYGGYHFSPDDMIEIYHPYSLMKALDTRVNGDYWYDKGVPNYLAKLSKSSTLKTINIADLEILISDVINVPSEPRYALIPLLYLSGYLTIESYQPMFQLFTPCYPNREVERSLNSLA